MKNEVTSLEQKSARSGYKCLGRELTSVVQYLF